MNISDKPSFSNVADLIKTAMAQGTSAGIERFLITRKVDVSPGIGSPSPVAAFTVAFLGEYGESRAIYPFAESLKGQLDSVASELVPHINNLWSNNEHDNALALARTVFYGETLLFLDKHLKEALSVIKAIRDTPLS